MDDEFFAVGDLVEARYCFYPASHLMIDRGAKMMIVHIFEKTPFVCPGTGASFSTTLVKVLSSTGVWVVNSDRLRKLQTKV